MGRKILLLANLGSPQSPAPKDVGRYLREFLMDPWVLDIPWAARFLLVHGLIVPFRKFRSSEAYRKIWTTEGSPLVATTKKFSEALAAKMQDEYEVHWAMRYSGPRIDEVVCERLSGLTEQDQIYFVPLYPHYATSSTQTALEVFEKAVRRHCPKTTTFYLKDFFDARPFIEAFSQKISTVQKSFYPDYILFSYHGLPERQLKKVRGGDACAFDSCCEIQRFENQNCYRAQTFRTTQLIAHQLHLKADQYGISYQSRLGRTPWIRPFTDVKIRELAARGVRRLAVACPSFVTDCLETLEEIQIAARDSFVQAGGEDLTLVPCPNDSQEWVLAFADLVRAASWRNIGE